MCKLSWRDRGMVGVCSRVLVTAHHCICTLHCMQPRTSRSLSPQVSQVQIYATSHLMLSFTTGQSSTDLRHLAPHAVFHHRSVKYRLTPPRTSCSLSPQVSQVQTYATSHLELSFTTGQSSTDLRHLAPRAFFHHRSVKHRLTPPRTSSSLSPQVSRVQTYVTMHLELFYTTSHLELSFTTGQSSTVSRHLAPQTFFTTGWSRSSIFLSHGSIDVV